MIITKRVRLYGADDGSKGYFCQLIIPECAQSNGFYRIRNKETSNTILGKSPNTNFF